MSFSRPLKGDIDYCVDCDVDAVNLVVPTSNLHIKDKLNIVDVISYNGSKLNDGKQDIVKLAKQTPYFNIINSIYGIGEFTTSIIIAELGDINRFNNIKRRKTCV